MTPNLPVFNSWTVTYYIYTPFADLWDTTRMSSWSPPRPPCPRCWSVWSCTCPGTAAPPARWSAPTWRWCSASWRSSGCTRSAIRHTAPRSDPSTFSCLFQPENISYLTWTDLTPDMPHYKLGHSQTHLNILDKQSWRKPTKKICMEETDDWLYLTKSLRKEIFYFAHSSVS